jgi:hypothetical protein
MSVSMAPASVAAVKVMIRNLRPPESVGQRVKFYFGANRGEISRKARRQASTRAEAALSRPRAPSKPPRTGTSPVTRPSSIGGMLA